MEAEHRCTILTENYPLTIKKTWLTKTEKEGNTNEK
jgi:hypothetical protein